MKKIKFGILFLSLVSLFAFKADKPAYRLYTQDGKAVKYEKMITALQSADIVFYGELHNNPIAHWLEYEITKDLYAAKQKNLVLGAEMFESDNQLIIDEYFKGYIKQSHFEKELRLWPNYKTDYKPLLEFAKTNGLRFVATNIPRRYAAFVNAKGLDSLAILTAEAKSYIAPLPIPYDGDLPAYKNILEMMKDMPHANPNLPKAQAVKDATMAHFILKNWKAGKLFLHYNGSYHSDDFQSIIWYLKQANPNLNILSISSVEQDDVEALESDYLNKANYIVAIPSDMTKTY